GRLDRDRWWRRKADRLPDAVVVESASFAARLVKSRLAARRRLEPSAESRHHGDERGRAWHCARQRAGAQLSRRGGPHEPDNSRRGRRGGVRRGGFADETEIAP